MHQSAAAGARGGFSPCSTASGLCVAPIDLTDMGLTLEEVGAVAATWQVADGLDAEGRLKHRNARPDNALSSSYSGPEAARAANGGVVPPDRSPTLRICSASRRAGDEARWQVAVNCAQPFWWPGAVAGHAIPARCGFFPPMSQANACICHA